MGGAHATWQGGGIDFRNFSAIAFCWSPSHACWCPVHPLCRGVAPWGCRRHCNFPADFRNFSQLDVTLPDRNPPPPLDLHSSPVPATIGASCLQDVAAPCGASPAGVPPSCPSSPLGCIPQPLRTAATSWAALGHCLRVLGGGWRFFLCICFVTPLFAHQHRVVHTHLFPIAEWRTDAPTVRPPTGVQVQPWPCWGGNENGGPFAKAVCSGPLAVAHGLGGGGGTFPGAGNGGTCRNKRPGTAMDAASSCQKWCCVGLQGDVVGHHVPDCRPSLPAVAVSVGEWQQLRFSVSECSELLFLQRELWGRSSTCGKMEDMEVSKMGIWSHFSPFFSHFSPFFSHFPPFLCHFLQPHPANPPEPTSHVLCMLLFHFLPPPPVFLHFPPFPPIFLHFPPFPPIFSISPIFRGSKILVR